MPPQTDSAHGFLHVREEASQREEIYSDRFDMAVPHGTGAAVVDHDRLSCIAMPSPWKQPQVRLFRRKGNCGQVGTFSKAARTKTSHTNASPSYNNFYPHRSTARRQIDDLETAVVMDEKSRLWFDICTIGTGVRRMTAQRYLVRIPCPRCQLSLLRSPETVEPPIVFCDLCLAGGPYDAVVERGSAVNANYVTRDRAKRMLLEILQFGF
jgi:hypothetical protein